MAANAKLCGFSGVYACWNWPEVPTTGAGFADWVNEELKRCDLGQAERADGGPELGERLRGLRALSSRALSLTDPTV